MSIASNDSRFNGYTLYGKAEFEDDLLADIQVLSIKPKAKVELEPSGLEQFASKFRSGIMKNITLKNSSKEDYELFTHLVANKDRAKLTTDSTKEIGLKKQSVRTSESLTFIVGKYRNKIYDALKEKQVFLDIFDREDPMEFAKVNTLINGEHKTIEIIWLVDPEIIRTEYHENFDLDSVPLIQEQPRKQNPWEKRNLTEEEYNKLKLQSRLDDLMEQSPEKFAKLLDFIDTL
jgi:hypothetical protein